MEKLNQVNLKPTAAMAEEAARGLAWREEYGRGGTAVGVARARDLKNRKNLSPRTVRRMKSYFARHEVDKQGEGFSPGEEGYPSAGRIAWALWGGDAGQSWANEKVRQLDNEENNMNKDLPLLLMTLVALTGELKELKEINQTPTKVDNQTENKEMKKTFYAIEKINDRETTIYLYDEVGGYGAGSKDFLAALSQLEGTHIHLRINSPGGSVIEGTAIYNALKRHKGGLTVHIDALAASMASVIAMAGDKVYISDNAMIMIHNPWTMAAGGDANELRKQADLLDKLKNTLVTAYEKKTGLSREELEEMMDKETWLDAVEAVALGFADAIEEGNKAEAKATPDQLKARFQAFAGTNVDTKTEENTMIVSKAKFDQAIQSLEAANTNLLALQTEKEELIASLTSQTEELVSIKSILEAESTKALELNSKVATLEAQLAEAQTAAKDFEEQVKAEADKRALELVAATGTAVVSLPLPNTNPLSGSTEPKTYGEFSETFKKLSETDQRAAGEYFNKFCDKFFTRKN